MSRPPAAPDRAAATARTGPGPVAGPVACLVTAAVALVAAIVGVIGSTAQPAAAAGTGRVVHVSPSGRDSGDGTVDHPWRTIATATARAGAQARILVAGGTYQPFRITRPGQEVQALAGQRVVVRGRAGVQDVIRIDADDALLIGLTVTGCVPASNPPGGFDAAGSSDVRIDDGTSGATLRQLTITDSRGTNSSGRPFGCFGVFAHNATGFHVEDSDISGTGTGVFVNGQGQGGVITGNQIHHNDVLIRDTPGATGTTSADDDYGASGVFLVNVSATPGVTVSDNVLVGNRGPSADYGIDGSGIDFFNASNATIADNTIGNNNVALETGAADGGGCIGNVFRGNQVSGPLAGSAARSPGMILRCATGMRIAGNTFTNLSSWVFDIDVTGGFATDVNQLTILDNTVRQQDPVYLLGVPPDQARLFFDRNRFERTGSTFAQYVPYYSRVYTSAPTLTSWRQRTGLDRDSTAG